MLLGALCRKCICFRGTGRRLRSWDKCVMSRWFVVLALRCVSFSIVVHNRYVGYEAI